MKLTNSCNLVIYTLDILFLLDYDYGVRKKNDETRPLNFGKRNRRSCIARAATLAPFLVRFMTQSDTMAHGTDHKTWETTLSPSGSGTVLARNHHAGSFALFVFFPVLPREIGPENRMKNNYYAPPNSRAELIIPRFNSQQ